jgi:hypothetical protein
MVIRSLMAAVALFAGAGTLSIAQTGNSDSGANNGMSGGVMERQCWDSMDNMVRDQPPTGTVGSGGGNANGKTGRLGDREGMGSGSEGNSPATSGTGTGSSIDDREAANAAGIRPPGMRNC